MNNILKPLPELFDKFGKFRENPKDWIEKFELTVTLANDREEKMSKEKKVALLKLSIGDRARLRLKRSGTADSYVAIKREIRTWNQSSSIRERNHLTRDAKF
ncbi:hypothetical protein A3Q56_02601 [Intoshia linei]|uniref:Uncharacterized protein n=1 Tax=Intoshia linei TaxID=1819745 RepID=A0A177B7J2_9BILA|nr:hypothetical protein A3Q56_02601 [Intoshia linei]